MTHVKKPLPGHIVDSAKVAGRMSDDAWVFYIDDRRQPEGRAYRKKDGTDQVMGELRSLRGHTARNVADSIDALQAELARWAGIGFPADDPLVREWTAPEKKTFDFASLDF